MEKGTWPRSWKGLRKSLTSWRKKRKKQRRDAKHIAAASGLFLPSPSIDEMESFFAARRKGSRKIAVFTAIVGAYDQLTLPTKLNSDIDYVVFSDAPVPTFGVWKVRPIPYHHTDATRVARYVKTHPHTLFPSYDLVIWIDANVSARTDFKEYIARIEEADAAIGCVPHPLRDCVFAEAAACKELKKDDPQKIDAQMTRYRSLGFREQAGLFETNFLLFNLRSPDLATTLRTWWNELDLNSRRDQLSFGWALRETGAKVLELFERGVSCRDHPDFELLPHYVTRFRQSPPALRDVSEISAPFLAPRYAELKSELAKASHVRRADVIVCVWNALEDVKVCLESVTACRRESERLIIVNDCSDTPTTEYLRAFADGRSFVSLLENEENLGYTGTANRGLLASDADFRVLLNSDTIVSPNWLAKMMDVAYANDAVGIVGPMSNAASWQSIPDHRGSVGQTAINTLPAGLTPLDCDKACERWSFADCFPSVPLVHGFCLGIKRQVIDKIGVFDAVNFARFYGEENDYCFRARRAGFELAIATNVFVYHAKSRSIAEEVRLIHMDAAGRRFREIYGQEEVMSAVTQMAEHPLLKRMRECAAIYWSKFPIDRAENAPGYGEVS